MFSTRKNVCILAQVLDWKFLLQGMPNLETTFFSISLIPQNVNFLKVNNKMKAKPAITINSEV